MLSQVDFDCPAHWTASGLATDDRWIFRLTSEQQTEIADAVRAAFRPGRSLFSYTRGDFAFPGVLDTLRAAAQEVRSGRGIALVKGLPRAQLDEDHFRLMTWAIGLHAGVARPQGKATQYISAVRNVGTDYRSATGRGYSSNAELDYHTDTADRVYLSCYNTARKGGTSMCVSSVAAYGRICSERPDLAEVLAEPFAFSTQGEQVEGARPFTLTPIFTIQDGSTICRWVRNRLETAQQLPGVPRLTALQREAVDYLDEVVRRDELVYRMNLEPGDLQIVNSHVTLHSRTEFEDYDEPDRKRTLYRLWIAPPDSMRLPASWKDAYKSIEPGSVRGGILGQQYDPERRAFEKRQAAELGMRWSEPQPALAGG